MKTKILAGLLLGASALAAAPRVSFGIGFGVPARPYYYAPAPVYVAPAPVYAPAYVAPAPAYGYAGGYWEGYGVHRVWRPYRVERGGFRYRR